MRELTFKGYLQQQLCNLSDCNSKSLYKFALLSEHNARLKNVLCLYVNYYVQSKLKLQLCKKYPYLSKGCAKLNNVQLENLNDCYSEYGTIYDNYLNQKNTNANENKLKTMMQRRIVEIQAEKGITNYRIYKELNLNPGNINAFLKNGDICKIGLNTARRILAFVSQ